jgi:Ni,Fe-hydrogenase III large subunit
MSGQFHRLDADEFERRMVAECESGVPLGAYASLEGLHYLFLGSYGAFSLERSHLEGRAARAFSARFPLLSWDEREMHDEWDVRFTDLPDSRPLRARDGEMPAALLATGSGLMHMVVGPVHAGIIEPGRFTFSSGGETVVHLDAQLSYSHRGVEQRLVGAGALEAAPYVARICGGCSASRSLAYAQALEKLAGIELDRAVEFARLVVVELERVYNHLADLAASASGAGWGPGFARGMALKERAMRACQLATGHRLLFDAIVPGGIGPNTLLDRSPLRNELRELGRAAEGYMQSLFGNASVVARWKRAGSVSRQMAHAFGAVGPAERAAGGKVDVRAFAPYGAYRELGVDAASAVNGDAFARCAVKRDEIRESLRLIDEVLSRLGDARLEAPEVVRATFGSAIGVVEGARGAETVAVHVDERGRLTRLHVISASYRNWPIVARAMDGNIVPDFPLVNKSFNLCYACADR